MKKEIAIEISKYVKLKQEEIENLIEIPPDEKLGDFALPCFQLAAKMKKNPLEIAKELAKKIKLKNIKVQAKGPYINFFVDKEKLAEQVLDIKEGFGSKKGKEKIL